jgi:hypothetical protein
MGQVASNSSQTIYYNGFVAVVATNGNYINFELSEQSSSPTIYGGTTSAGTNKRSTCLIPVSAGDKIKFVHDITDWSKGAEFWYVKEASV